MNDPYMPLEAKLEITRQALQVIAQKHFPVHIITKGKLVTRDIDILKEINKTYCAVSLTITTADDNLAEKIEPHASKSSERFATIETLALQGIYCGVTLMPLLPGINDNWQNIETIIRKAVDSGASYIIPMLGLTLRKGSREYLYKAFDKDFPGMKQTYEKQFDDNYMCYGSDYKNLYQRCFDLCAKLGISTKMKFYEGVKDQQLSLF